LFRHFYHNEGYLVLGDWRFKINIFSKKVKWNEKWGTLVTKFETVGGFHMCQSVSKKPARSNPGVSNEHGNKC